MSVLLRDKLNFLGTELRLNYLVSGLFMVALIWIAVYILLVMQLVAPVSSSGLLLSLLVLPQGHSCYI